MGRVTKKFLITEVKVSPDIANKIPVVPAGDHKKPALIQIPSFFLIVMVGSINFGGMLSACERNTIVS